MEDTIGRSLILLITALLTGCGLWGPSTLTIKSCGISCEIPFQKQVTCEPPSVSAVKAEGRTETQTGFIFVGEKNTIRVYDRELAVDGKRYGDVRDGDNVRVDRAGLVYVNGTRRQGELVACPASSRAQGGYVLYDDFTWPNTTLDRKKWWRGGLAGVDGANAILNESDLTSSMLFLGGDFRFVIGGPSATSQGLFGLGDIDDGDPYLVLSSSGAGWRFHVRNGSEIHTGPVIASSLARGDVVVFHWDSNGSSVSVNGVVKDSQTKVHPPRMPLTMLEWNNSSTNGQIIMDSVSYSASTASKPEPPATTPVASARAMVLSATLVEDTFVDSSNPGTSFNGSAHQIYIRNCRYHPDLTGEGKTVDAGHLGLVQFRLPQLPAGWSVTSARLAAVVAQNHRPYGMPGWAPARPIELEVLGLSVNPDLATVTYNALHDATGHGVISAYTASGSVNFAFGSQAQSLGVLRFSTSTTPVGSLLQFPDQEGKLLAFVRSRISQTEPRPITLAIGPGRTQAVSGMDCDFRLYAKENTQGRTSMSLTLELEQVP